VQVQPVHPEQTLPPPTHPQLELLLLLHLLVLVLLLPVL
jgi:hypothetical protein